MRRFLHRWHRRIGVIAALFVILLSTTGILLNHTDRLQLDSRYANFGLLRMLYGLPAMLDVQIINVDGRSVSQFEEVIYIDTTSTENCAGELRGAVALNAVAGFDTSLLIACSNGLLWLDTVPTFLDFIPAAQLHSNEIVTLGLDERNQPVINNGEKLFSIDMNTLDMTPISGPVVWATLQSADRATAQRLTNHFYREAITWERLLLDIHSGRLFAGTFGVLLMDASAVVLLLLSISGLCMWWLRKN